MKTGTAAVLLLSLASCTSYYEHRFLPAPLEVQVGVDGDSDSQARTLLTVIGIRKPDKRTEQPAQVEVRLRIENLGRNEVQLDGGSLSLIAADLRVLGAPQVTPEPEPLSRDEAAVYDIVFRLPPGAKPKHYNLTGLNLGYTLDFGVKRVTTGVTFERYAQAEVGRRSYVMIGLGRGI